VKARWGYAATIAVMAVCTIAGTALLSLLSVTDVAMLYLVAVGLVASRSARGPSVFAAVLAVASFDFFFVPPRFTFTVDDLHYVFTFAMMLACALVISWLTERVREDARAERQREQGTAVLYPMSAELLAASSLAQVDALVRRHARAAFAADAAIALRDHQGKIAPWQDADDIPVAQWAFDMWQTAGRGTLHFPEAHAIYLPLVGSHGRLGVLGLLSDDPDRFDEPAQQWLLQTFAGQVALAIERVEQGAAV
jgi:two-component system sensor histidine kinase KdpD